MNRQCSRKAHKIIAKGRKTGRKAGGSAFTCKLPMSNRRAGKTPGRRRCLCLPATGQTGKAILAKAQ
ncbi:MAG: hypothetical protein DU429_04040 [Candidatus Tokpelaia sp.]|nr:MAG: hypothetical protein DU430_06335 [Candidatus Tokpelaia sp.]KAA6207027.1 MAG: hypothetical protein DU429_04040 [Candidatus Tokpelaia sp.]